MGLNILPREGLYSGERTAVGVRSCPVMFQISSEFRLQKYAPKSPLLFPSVISILGLQASSMG